MIHVFSDDPDGNERLDALKRGLGDPQLQDLNTTVLDGQKLLFDDLRGACEALPFLVDRRLVLVRGLLSRYEQKPGAKDRRKQSQDVERRVPELVRQFREYLPILPSSVEVVFVEGVAITKQNPLHKVLVSAATEFAQTPRMTPAALQEWIECRVGAKGGRLATGAARLLASFGGENLRALDLDLDKLVAYAGSGEVDARAINQLVVAAREGNVYKLGDAIAEGDTRSALRRLHELLAEGESPLYLLTMIARHFRLLVQIKELRTRGLGDATIASRVRLQEFVVERMTRQLRRYQTFEQLEQVYRRLLDSDVASKTGRGDLVTSLELLIADLAQRG